MTTTERDWSRRAVARTGLSLVLALIAAAVAWDPALARPWFDGTGHASAAVSCVVLIAGHGAVLAAGAAALAWRRSRP